MKSANKRTSSLSQCFSLRQVYRAWSAPCEDLAHRRFNQMQVFTDAIPFSDNTPATAMAGILRGKRPPRPKHPAITGRVWRLIQRCWDKDPRLRPDAAEILQELNESSVSRPAWQIPTRELDASLYRNPPTWKLLIVNTLSMDERIPLITFIFSDHDEVEALKYLSRCDAQAFVNVIDEASTPSPKDGYIFLLNLHSLSLRHWTEYMAFRDGFA